MYYKPPVDEPAPDTEEGDVRLDGFDFWFGELARLGLSSPQAERLAGTPGVDRHAVREALLAAKRRGSLDVDADFVFDAFS